jgi:hypothetical protein
LLGRFRIIVPLPSEQAVALSRIQVLVIQASTSFGCSMSRSSSSSRTAFRISTP